jgi:hypothetical protein
MRRFLLSGFLVCAISTLSHLHAEQTKKQPDKQQEHTRANPYENCQPTQASIRPSEAVAEKNSRNDQDRSAENISKRERFVRWLIDAKSTDVLMVVLTLAYVVTTAYLLIAVRRQAEIAISGERAWLFEIEAPQYLPGDTTLAPRCYVGFKNFGKSPAWIASIAGSFQWIDDPMQLAGIPFYEHINWGDILPVSSEDPQHIVVSHRIGNDRTESARLAVFVSIEYRDRFNLSMSRKPRRLRYCFISTDGTLRNWTKAGPDQYNEYT